MDTEPVASAVAASGTGASLAGSRREALRALLGSVGGLALAAAVPVIAEAAIEENWRLCTKCRGIVGSTARVPVRPAAITAWQCPPSMGCSMGRLLRRTTRPAGAGAMSAGCSPGRDAAPARQQGTPITRPVIPTTSNTTSRPTPARWAGGATASSAKRCSGRRAASAASVPLAAATKAPQLQIQRLQSPVGPRGGRNHAHRGSGAPLRSGPCMRLAGRRGHPRVGHRARSAAAAVKSGWRWCLKCRGLNAGQGNKSVGVCPDTDAHKPRSVDIYVLLSDLGAENAELDKFWFRCQKCRGLFADNAGEYRRLPQRRGARGDRCGACVVERSSSNPVHGSGLGSVPQMLRVGLGELPRMDSASVRRAGRISPRAQLQDHPHLVNQEAACSTRHRARSG